MKTPLVPLMYVPWRRLVVLLIQLMLVVQCLNTMEEQPVMLSDAGMTYECNPDTYKSKGIACEMGDFSGKYGLVQLGEDLLVQAQGVKDYFAPPESMLSEQWNIGINPVCPSAGNPQLVCAKVQMDGDCCNNGGVDQSVETSGESAAESDESCA